MQTSLSLTRDQIINYIREKHLAAPCITNHKEEENNIPDIPEPKIKALPVISPEPNEENWQSILESVLITEHSIFPECQDAINRIEPDQSRTRIVPNGSLVAFTGAAKSGKSKLACQITAAGLQLGSYKGLLESSIQNVMYIDSEQSIYDVKKTHDTIYALLDDKTKIKKLTLYAWRKFSHKERRFLLDKKMSESPNIDLLVIDGIRDFVSDPNLADEANLIVSSLLKWSSELGIAIIVIIHQNKADFNMRGHLGTEIMNKADCVVTVTNKGKRFVVKPKVSRGKEFSSFAFMLNEMGVPVIDNSFVEADEDSDTRETSSELLQEVLLLAYSKVRDTLPGWSDLMGLLSVAFKSKSVQKGENQLRGIIKDYVDLGWLEKVPVAGRSYKGYQLILKQ